MSGVPPAVVPVGIFVVGIRQVTLGTQDRVWTIRPLVGTQVVGGLGTGLVAEVSVLVMSMEFRSPRARFT